MHQNVSDRLRLDVFGRSVFVPIKSLNVRRPLTFSFLEGFALNYFNCVDVSLPVSMLMTSESEQLSVHLFISFSFLVI